MKPKKILIAYEDDRLIRSLPPFLNQFGYRAEAVTAVCEMIKRIRNGDIHVVLLDDEVEGLKAWDLAALVKKINSKIQIIGVSSEQSISLVKRLRGAGIFYQAMKPVDLEEIRAAVECAFEKIERENPREGFFSFLTPKMVPA